MLMPKLFFLGIALKIMTNKISSNVRRAHSRPKEWEKEEKIPNYHATVHDQLEE